LRTLSADPRIDYRVAHARACLAHAARKFDMVVADAQRPSSAYAGNLLLVWIRTALDDSTPRVWSAS
jgi:spermidine synthase